MLRGHKVMSQCTFLVLILLFNEAVIEPQILIQGYI